jgi:hypothetical protein
MPEEFVHDGWGPAWMTTLMDDAVFDSVPGGGSVHMTKRLQWVDVVPLHSSPFRAESLE